MGAEVVRAEASAGADGPRTELKVPEPKVPELRTGPRMEPCCAIFRNPLPLSSFSRLFTDLTNVLVSPASLTSIVSKMIWNESLSASHDQSGGFSGHGNAVMSLSWSHCFASCNSCFGSLSYLCLPSVYPGRHMSTTTCRHMLVYLCLPLSTSVYPRQTAFGYLGLP
jgi:hypothetical protein